MLRPVFRGGGRLSDGGLAADVGHLGGHRGVRRAGSCAACAGAGHGRGRMAAGTENVLRHRHLPADRGHHGPVAQRGHHWIFHLSRPADHHAPDVPAGGVSADQLHLLRSGHVLRRGGHRGGHSDGAGTLRRRGHRRDGGHHHRRGLFRRPVLSGILQRGAGGGGHGHGAGAEPAADAPHRLAAVCGESGGVRGAVRDPPAGGGGRAGADDTGGDIPAGLVDSAARRRPSSCCRFAGCPSGGLWPSACWRRWP